MWGKCVYEERERSKRRERAKERRKRETQSETETLSGLGTKFLHLELGCQQTATSCVLLKCFSEPA